MKRPNVLLVVLDDLGFAQLGCYGAEIRTPVIDRLAVEGARYTEFHVTALCSPSRACFLTGRNHHAVGMGLFPEIPLVDPGYTGRLPADLATLPRMLTQAGYATRAIGKWHLTPAGDKSAAGPFTSWPLGQGFERFYGFHGGMTNQWAPELVRDNHQVPAPKTYVEGYHLTEDLADEAVRQLRDLHQADPQKPFFMYFAPAAPHSPHQVPREWSDAYAGEFDDGWEAVRSRVFERQLREGVVPEGTMLAPRPSWVPDWAELDPQTRAVYARMHEVYAGFMSHVDHHIGLVISTLEELGRLDDTLVMLVSDNGASAEGGPTGSFNSFDFNFGAGDQDLTPEEVLAELGGYRAYNHYPWGWAWAGNTPFHLWKRYTWLGGTRAPLIIRYPREVTTRGEVKRGFAHAVDVMPTVIDVVGLTAPTDVDGQSFRDSFGPARSPARERTQYFEILGSRSVYLDGWKATTDRVIQGAGREAELIPGSAGQVSDRWQLHDLSTDFAEVRDVADEHPERLQRMVDAWHAEAERNQVMPMLEGPFAEMISRAKARDDEPRDDFVLAAYSGRVDEDVAPPLSQGFRLEAFVGTAADRAEGIICAQGNWTNGWAFYLSGGELTFALSRVGREYRVTAPDITVADATVLGLDCRPGGPSTRVVLSLDGSTLVESSIDVLLPQFWQYGGASLLVGYDAGLPVTTDYQPPFRWTGSFTHVRIRTRGAATAPDIETTSAGD